MYGTRSTEQKPVLPGAPCWCTRSLSWLVKPASSYERLDKGQIAVRDGRFAHTCTCNYMHAHIRSFPCCFILLFDHVKLVTYVPMVPADCSSLWVIRWHISAQSCLYSACTFSSTLDLISNTSHINYQHDAQYDTLTIAYLYTRTRFFKKEKEKKYSYNMGIK